MGIAGCIGNILQKCGGPVAPPTGPGSMDGAWLVIDDPADDLAVITVDKALWSDPSKALVWEYEAGWVWTDTSASPWPHDGTKKVVTVNSEADAATAIGSFAGNHWVVLPGTGSWSARVKALLTAGGGRAVVQGGTYTANGVPGPARSITLVEGTAAGPGTTRTPPPAPPPVPAQSWTKAEIIVWLAAQGVTLSDKARKTLSKPELLDLVAAVLSPDPDGDALLARARSL